MARITMRKVQETKLSEVFTLYLASAAARGVKDKTLRTYEQHFNRGVERTSIHAFRHTFARKYLVDCGGDAFTLQQIMGHSTLKMTRHYCNIFNDDIIENHEQRSPLAHLTQAKRQTIKK